MAKKIGKINAADRKHYEDKIETLEQEIRYLRLKITRLEGPAVKRKKNASSSKKKRSAFSLLCEAAGLPEPADSKNVGGRPRSKTKEEMESAIKDWEKIKKDFAEQLGKAWVTDKEFIDAASKRDLTHADRSQSKEILTRTIKYWRDQTGVTQRKAKNLPEK